MRKWIWLGLAVLLGLAAYTAAGPYLTIRAIQQAVQEDDTRALARQVDFPALRGSLKLQLDDAMVRRAGPEVQASLLGRIGLQVASGVSAGLVETMVTPVGLAALMEGRRVWRRIDISAPPRPAGAAGEAGKPLQDAEHRYQSPSRFTATVHDDDGRPIVFVLTRKGIRWRLSDIRLPL
ncbi:DUF2939 domain-containing protein [Luteimonas sp. RD2P54]|uniref:DUF2939 domain-containing protein n=1 Tax=Luteimonas endophytica TaxID=3042023 RepID=A0ABT6JAG1_9GAMM|nr:DUF2939 domain-containing protein [Luteimonas endophytica]MDH5823183.1 DUF2939 domain-containing protein [Luteimonas endophytica]